MKKSNRYITAHLPEDQYEPGSRKQVLKNLQKIKSKKAINQIEAEAQLQALEKFTNIYDQKHKFTSDDICSMHKIWLGDIYSWAGQYRTVNISKAGFSFAAARHVPQLMKQFEQETLSAYTPCVFPAPQKIAEALALVHVELILIHPFREGNGRLGRLLSTVMALQAGLPSLNFGTIKGEKKKEEYFSAIRAGMAHNYGPMQKIFLEIIARGESQAI